ncbi:MAG TPA: T9SS type A sorting domain-containing protein [Chitinophagaceae bacterium]|nr:T9SS type A sorting domain-containing protein [Chitinophagaceae bacterium]
MRPSTSSSRKLTISVLYAAVLLLALSGLNTANAQNCYVNPRIKKITANVSATIKSYMEFKPVDWNANPTKKYPLIVYFGGTGEMFQQPGGSSQDLCNVLQYSMPWRMNVGHFPDYVTDPNTGQQYSYFVVMPFVTDWSQQYSLDPGAMIDYVIQNYPNRIDLNRIYLTGMSRGTDNLMGYATGSSTSASRLAAIVPVGNCFPDYTGSGNMTLFNQQVNNLASGNVRMWGISCQGDKVCTENYIKNWVSALNTAKPGNALFTYATQDCDTVAPNGSFHYAWNQAYNPDYRAAPGNKNVYEWMIQFSKNGGGGGGGTPPAQPNCSTITVVPGSSSLKIKGLLAPVATVHIFNSSWATVFNQTYTNSPDSITVSNLPQGTYQVKVNFYTSSWSHICEKMQAATVGSTPPPPPPPPPPPTGTPDCNNITVSPLANALKLKGLVAPVVAVHIFNGSWATAYNRTFTNSPDSITVTSLPAGTYHVKVTFYTSAWSPICEKMQTVSVSNTAPPIVNGRTQGVPVTEPVNANTNVPAIAARRLTVAPNPFAHALMVTIGSAKNENATITIMDMAGRIVMKRPVSLQIGVNTIQLTGLANFKPGSYWLRLTTSDGAENVRLLRQ